MAQSLRFLNYMHEILVILQKKTYVDFKFKIQDVNCIAYGYNYVKIHFKKPRRELVVKEVIFER